MSIFGISLGVDELWEEGAFHGVREEAKVCLNEKRCIKDIGTTSAKTIPEPAYQDYDIDTAIHD